MISTIFYNNRMDNFLTPVFFVNETAEVKAVPTNGEEFLQKVIAERDQCPEYISVEAPYSTRQNYFVVEPPKTASAPATLKPTIEWQNIQLSDFYSMRIHVIRLSLEHAKVHKPSGPKMEDIVPLLGKDFFMKKPPGLRLMLACKQKHLDLFLEIILEILNDTQPGDSIEDSIGQWIYAILIRQGNPVLSDTSCLLRNLARKCAQIRSHLPMDDEKSIEMATPLNLFICIVARYFREIDLAD